MKQIHMKTINKEHVDAVPLLKNLDRRPVLGSSLFPESYGNIFYVHERNLANLA